MLPPHLKKPMTLKYNIEVSPSQLPTAIKQIATFTKVEREMQRQEDMEDCRMSPDCLCDECREYARNFNPKY